MFRIAFERHRARLAAVAAALWVTVAAGCGPRHRVDHQLWTLFSIRDAFRAQGKVAFGPTFPNGMPASTFLTDQENLKVVPAFAEGRPAATVTTEIWVSYGDDVWPEPMYIQVVDGGNPPAYLVGSDGRGAPWITDVGPQSSFYSPFWEVSYASVGDLSADPDHYRSGDALFDAGVPLTFAGARTSPLAPLDFSPTPPGQHLVEPTWGTELEDIPTGQVWTGEDNRSKKVSFLDFGAHLFSVIGDERDGSLIEPLPLFMFVKSDGTGAPPAPIDAPRVGGVGPLYSGRAAEVVIDPATQRPQPHFGGYWRVVSALLPAGGDAFHASANQATASAAAGRGVDLKAYEGRVALDAACFAGTATFPAGCTWLDSQAAIEQALGATRIVETELTETSPFVFYDQLPVKR